MRGDQCSDQWKKNAEDHVALLSAIKSALLCVEEGNKGWQHQHQHRCSHSKQKGLLFSEDACNRHRMGKDAKQLAGKLTASTVTVWKYFNKLETISKMVDSSDSVRRQRAALCRPSVYFSSMIKFTAKRQATGDRPPSSRCYFCRPLLAAPLGFLPLPAHTNTALATTKANMCDLLQFTTSGGEKKTKKQQWTDWPSHLATISSSAE